MSVVRVDAPGALSSLQDRGRFGWRHMGVPWSGALDPEALAVANRLVGNPPHAPAIECFEGGLMLTAEDGGVRLAVAGSARMRIDGASGSRSVDSWRSFDLEPGDCLRLQACEGRQRCALVAVHGLQVPLQLGSASTYARAQLGGMEGRNLRAG
ncbi:MAG: urea amidolyase, partial [Rhodocyclaceae bacterium]|nr:urea amidolyase [Rhodocyclaceae bacterium]